jgi:hypothetical protein
MDIDMGGAEPREPAANGFESQFGPVAISAQVGQVKVPEIGGDDLLSHVSGSFIA